MRARFASSRFRRARPRASQKGRASSTRGERFAAEASDSINMSVFTSVPSRSTHSGAPRTGEATVAGEFTEGSRA
jgi:hypothetical protein